MDPMIGETVGQYRLVSELGRGRFGITYRGEHITNGTTAVIKQLFSELTIDDLFPRRFIYESETLVRLYHVNIATVLGLIAQSGKYYIISEEIPGSNLAEYLKRKEKLSATESSEIIIALCSALDYLHKRNYYHRNLHPGNIIISKDGSVKLTDVGITNLIGELGLTKLIHKPELRYLEYLAPELKQGAAANPGMDIYSLGVLLYELITGERFEPRKLHPLIPVSLQRVIAKATAETFTDRYASITDITADLTVFLELGLAQRIPQRQIPIISEPTVEPQRIHPAWWTTWVFALVVLLALPLYYVFRPRGQNIESAISVSRQAPFKREPFTPQRPLEETVTTETTLGEKHLKKKTLVREESAVSFEPSPLVALPKIQLPRVEIGEETKYVERDRKPDTPKPFLGEKGELLNIPKEDTSMMRETVMPVPSIMVVVPAGEFIMGSNSGQPYEQPEHRVYLDTYLIDMYEVSNQQYKAFIDATGFPAPSGWQNRMYPAGQSNYPVTNITWAEASAYANWVGCRLPTEAEWEKAARGTDGRMYPWGNQFIENVCNYVGANYHAPVPVGIYPKGRSPYGCYDMAGNVAEWTADIFRPYAGNTVIDSRVFVPDNFVIRGGAFNSPKEDLRSSARGLMHITKKSPSVGFRTVKSLGGIQQIAKLTFRNYPIQFLLAYQEKTRSLLAKYIERDYNRDQ
ncbi:MAG: bifunctional serine/threonine-protein kinase/formylglycine-generating enzyme family protein [bacterium]|nr:bifunctional serine/threonine-protein kinase/formylglycine-generating enzyme family protein [bacterium]